MRRKDNNITLFEYFWNVLPDCEKDCINCLPRYPLRNVS